MHSADIDHLARIIIDLAQATLENREQRFSETLSPGETGCMVCGAIYRGVACLECGRSSIEYGYTIEHKIAV